MSDLETQLVKILNDFGGEASLFLITHPDSPWAELGDAGALETAVKSLADAGTLNYSDDGTVSVA